MQHEYMSNVIEASRGYWVNNWISRRAELTPNWVVLKDNIKGPLRVYTYKTLNERICKLAYAIKNFFKTKKNEVVAMLSWPRIEVLEVLFACMKINLVFLPLNTRYVERELADVIKTINSSILIYEREFKDRVEGLEKFLDESKLTYVCLDCKPGEEEYIYDYLINESKPIEEVYEASLEDPVMFIQTGGTTGRPKMAIITYRMILWNALNTLRDLIVPGDYTITALPLFHIGGYTYTLPLLMFGGKNLIMHRWNVNKFIDYVETERPSFLFLVPTQLKMLLNNPRFKSADFSSVRWFTSGGGALTKDIIKEIFNKGIVMKQGYGLTEMGPGVFALDPWDAYRKMGSIGKPNLLIDAKIVGENGNILGVNKEGELILRAPSIFGGYYGNLEETIKTVSDGWLHTGDIAKYDEDGYYWIIGRKKNIIRSGEESVFPEEIEKLLKLHPSIVDAVVIGVEDPRWGEVPKAIIVLKEGMKLTKDEIIGFLEGKLAKYKIPKYIQVVNEIPKSELGKVSREYIKKLFGQPRDNI